MELNKCSLVAQSVILGSCTFSTWVYHPRAYGSKAGKMWGFGAQIEIAPLM